MDSQENILEQGISQETVNQEAAAPEVVTPAAAPEAPEIPETPEVAELPEVSEDPAPQEEERKVYESKKEVLDRVKEIAHGEEMPQKDEVDYLKTVFYKLHIAEREAKLREYIDGGGDPEKYQITPDEDEEVFKAEMGIIKERRQQLFREQEAEKEENLKKKLEIIEKIKAMVTSPEEANKGYQEFKALQQQWREIKNVPAEKASELWRNYQLYVEQFYDMLRLNSEAREYDFRKNKEQKIRLCEAAEKLADEPDIISAFHQLQKLHQEYREIGPVAKEEREEVRKSGTVSRLPAQSSTSATSSTSRASAPKKRRISPVRPNSVRRWRPSPLRRTRVAATGRSTPSRSSNCRPNGRPSDSLPRR